MGQLREKIKKAVPAWLMYCYYLYSATRTYMYDIRRRVRDKVYNANTEEKLFRDLTVAYHIIEKGLTMPEPRPGFGKAVVLSLCNMVFSYDKKGYPRDNISFVQAVSVLHEYQLFHKAIEYTPDSEVSTALSRVLEMFPDLKGEKQLRLSSKDFFANADQPFDKFCRSRYSVRHYAGKDIPLPVLYECIDLAQRSPSFCNRQPSRVHIVKSARKKQAILGIQNGNRGFGHLANTLLVITSSVSMTKDIHERHENHLNSGMFCMTLLNALHFHKIGACSLNWSVARQQDISIRKLLHIPDNEVVVLVISCGYVPDHFSVASSPRISANKITSEHL